MNEQCLLKLKTDMILKNFTTSTCEDYYRFVKRFLDFTAKDSMSITYADIRKFIFHMKDMENKKPTTNYNHKAMLTVTYSSGLRVSETCRLRCDDILRSRNMIHISTSKNREDRY